MKIVLSHKKKEILPFAAKRMDLEDIVLSEMRKKLYDLICIWNLGKIVKLMDAESRWVVTRSGGGGGGGG